jgi:uncharacterized membrane protein YhaH (DUF805 family)
MEYFIDGFRKYADFKGKASRSDFWGFILISSVVSVVLNQLDIQYEVWSAEYGIGFFSGLYSLAVIVPEVSILVRRLHDVGKSGWMALLLLLPIIGWIWVGILLFQPSKA